MCWKNRWVSLDRIAILAADVSPDDVISHFPVSCEKKDIPYTFIRSRMELGSAAQTKRPTSVVLLLRPDDDAKLAKKFDKMAKSIKESNPFAI
jgi:H/ACA ribonucleoprotein complex subunit 2